MNNTQTTCERPRRLTKRLFSALTSLAMLGSFAAMMPMTALNTMTASAAEPIAQTLYYGVPETGGKPGLYTALTGTKPSGEKIAGEDTTWSINAGHELELKSGFEIDAAGRYGLVLLQDLTIVLAGGVDITIEATLSAGAQVQGIDLNGHNLTVKDTGTLTVKGTNTYTGAAYGISNTNSTDSGSIIMEKCQTYCRRCKWCCWKQRSD